MNTPHPSTLRQVLLALVAAIAVVGLAWTSLRMYTTVTGAGRPIPQSQPAGPAQATEPISPTVTVDPTEPTATAGPTEPITATATVDPEGTPLPTSSAEPSETVTATLTVEPTGTMTGTPIALTATPTVTATVEITPTATMTATVEITPTATMTATVEVTPTATMTATVEITPTATMTATAEITPTATMTSTVVATPTLTPDAQTPTPLPPELALPFGANMYFLAEDDVGTGIQVQNLDRTQPASIEATLYNEAGQTVLTIPKQAAPGGAPNIYLPSYRTLQNLMPGIYSILVKADQPIGPIVRTDWGRTKGSAIYSYVSPASEIVVPYLVRRARNLTSMVTIQNAGDVPAEAMVTAYVGQSAPVEEVQLGPYALAPGAAVRIHLNFESEFLRFADLQGWMRVTSTGAPVAVQSYVFKEQSGRTIQPVMGFEGVPLASAAARLYVPLFRSSQRVFTDANRAHTSIAVANPGETAAEVSITYYGSTNTDAAPACRGQTFSHPAVMIPPNGSYVFDQRPGGGHDLPANCFGSAVIMTGGPNQAVTAMVIDVTNSDELMSAYDAVPAGGVGTEVALPLFRQNHVDLTTGIQVMNAGDEPAQVRIQFAATDASTDQSTPINGCTVCEQTVQPLQSYTWWPPSISAIPPNTFGSALVTSDQPVVVLVVDYPMKAQVDPAAYIGITAR
jgi:hypothetical protein